MRSVETRRFCYIFNPWADGERVFKTATTGTLTYRKMKEMAETDDKMAARVDLFDHRVLEELYDVENDPGALDNLVDDPAYKDELNNLRKILEDWMVETGDHALEAFRHRDDAELVSAYVMRVQEEATARRKQRTQAQSNAQRGNAAPAAGRKLISLAMLKKITPGEPLVVTVVHTIPDDLGEQLLHVTLKDGTSGKRVERKVVKARGTGETKLTFELPSDLAAKSIRVAAFIGKDYPNSLQHLVTRPILVE
jgi:N-sulfoglucosamine sulfohydrolase